jgi:hypothetical protein
MSEQFRFLLTLEEGAIVVSSKAAAEYQQRFGRGLPEGELIDDAFDPPDIMVDLVGEGAWEDDHGGLDS